MQKCILTIAILVSACISCSRIRPGEHATLAFENNSSDTIYVVCVPNDGVYDPSPRVVPTHFSKQSCEVAPNSINNDVAPLHFSGVAYSYEHYFSNTKNAKLFVYIVPIYSRDNQYDNTLVCYELTREDLISLDYHLYFPPNEKMRHIKMDPPYETFSVFSPF